MRPAQFLLRENTHGKPSIRSKRMTIDPEVIKSAAIVIIAFGVGLPVYNLIADYFEKRRLGNGRR
jgi:hypothetical protein